MPWGGPAVVDAAALAVAAVAANAAGAPVAVFRVTIESKRVPIEPFRLMRPPPWPMPPVPLRRPPVPLSPPSAARGPVEDEQTVADVPIRELILQATPLANAADTAVAGALPPLPPARRSLHCRGTGYR